MLPEGEYLGDLYDIGFDKPETHCIRKDGVLYYALYAPEWNGDVALRGLGAGQYEITDYVNNERLGVVNGPPGKLHVVFRHALLVKARQVAALTDRKYQKQTRQ